MSDSNNRADYLYNLGSDPYPFNSRIKCPSEVVKEKMDQLEVGQKIKSLTTSKPEIEYWKANDEYDQGIGIIPGKLKRKNQGQYLTVIDCDSKEIKEKILRGVQSTNFGIVNDLEYYSKKLYIEYHKDDPDRFHIIFISPVKFPTKERTIDTNTKKSIELEVYCDNNHWVTTSPSFHPNGYQYEPMGTDEITILNENDGLLFLGMLENIYKEYGIEYKEKEENVNSNNINSDLKPKRNNVIDKELIDLLVNVLKPYCNKDGGLRNSIYFATSGYLRKSGVIYETGKEFVKRLCEETDDEEIQSRLRVLINTYSENKENSKIIGYKALEELISKEELENLDNYILTHYENIYLSDRNLKARQKENKEAAIVDWLIIENHLLTFRDSEELLYYKDGIYVLGGEKLVNEIIEKEYTDEYSTHEINEFTNKIKRRTYVDRDEFDKDLDVFCFNNGLVNLWKPKEIKPHDPKYRCLFKIPHNYDPEAKAPKYEKALSEILGTQNRIDRLLEAKGYSLRRARPFDMFYIFVGSGDNGKSLVDELWIEMLGEDKVSHESFKNLTNNRFGLASLVGKNLNLDAELPKDTIVDSSMLKKLNSIHMMQIEEKFKPSYSLRLYVKLVFNANKIPRTYDNSDGFYKRVRIIVFPFKFVLKPQDQLKDNEKIANPNLVNELKEEMPGIINLCLEALRKLLTNKPVIDVDAQREQYQLLANPVGMFAKEEIEVWYSGMTNTINETTESGKQIPNIIAVHLEDCFLPKDKGYECYKEWCNKKDIPVTETYDDFCSLLKNEFKDLGCFINRVQKTVDGKPKTSCWGGIRLKNTIVEIEKPPINFTPVESPDSIKCEKCGWLLSKDEDMDEHQRWECKKREKIRM